jgi:hypothetical protein
MGVCAECEHYMKVRTGTTKVPYDYLCGARPYRYKTGNFIRGFIEFESHQACWRYNAKGECKLYRDNPDLPQNDQPD